MHTIILNTWEAEFETNLWLHIEFQVNQGYVVRPYLKKGKVWKDGSASRTLTALPQDLV